MGRSQLQTGRNFNITAFSSFLASSATIITKRALEKAKVEMTYLKNYGTFYSRTLAELTRKQYAILQPIFLSKYD